MRIAFCGASGTGKTTLVDPLMKTLGLEKNPIGSRSVAADMGFANPYDVDAAGRRVEFQTRLVTEKRAWEDAHDSFITDRTTVDNLAYSALHMVEAIDSDYLKFCLDGLARYTHIFFCPSRVFCNPAGDPARVQDLTYHRLYDIMLEGLIDPDYRDDIDRTKAVFPKRVRNFGDVMTGEACGLPFFHMLKTPDVAERINNVLGVINRLGPPP